MSELYTYQATIHAFNNFLFLVFDWFPPTEFSLVLLMYESQVQEECKGLPLALKVIGSSLYGQPHPAWEGAKNKLLKGESISDYHKEGLRCLETSIDALDEEARECFLDLGSFPEDRKISVDALLDIWIYVRNMEWHDAFVILLELASRNLLNLRSNLR